MLIEERVEAMNAKLRSSPTAPEPEDEPRRWSALIYIFVHHPKIQRLNAVVDCDARRIDRSKFEQKLAQAAWSNPERCLLDLAMYLYDMQYPFTISDIWRLESAMLRVAVNAIEIRLGLQSFEKVLSGDMAS
ncbi:hypothetical protein FHR92_003013 [Fontibacillus solani]|uniref:Uncharacterized protein n=1 Tax=Fontibacillus solani TaxID=1572857 RepID=A0A7W3SUK8_9BACL|nr:hypothetical protein [Fontibacillus solani]MBA9086535.1 hypothetical protein [Fontibacillus solani]